MRLCRNGYSLLLLTPVVPATRRKEIAMSRFRKLTHTLWHCQYHLVWVPKYRYRIFDGKVGAEAKICIRMFTEQSNCDVVELNVQFDHVHLIAMIPLKLSISDFVGKVKGRSAIRILGMFSELRIKKYWGNHLWTPGYCVDTVGLDAEMIRKYVKYQEKKERTQEQLQFKYN